MMKTFVREISRVNRLAATLAIGLLALGHAWGGTVTLKDGREVEGKLRVQSNGDVVVESAVGRQVISKAQIARVVGDKPAEFDAAMDLLKAKKYSAAILVLEKIVSAHRGLGWDQKALQVLGQAYMLNGDPAKSVSSYAKLLALNKDPGFEVILNYCEALLASKGYEKLDAHIDQIVAKAPRHLAAQAQIIRGDAKAARGQWDNAVLDYMRTVILYSAQEDLQPEALFKTANALTELGDKRAKDYFKRVASEYPDSAYAARAKAQL